MLLPIVYTIFDKLSMVFNKFLLTIMVALKKQIQEAFEADTEFFNSEAQKLESVELEGRAK